MGANRPADVRAAAGSLAAVVDGIDSGDLAAPRWLRDRLRAAVVAVDTAMPPARRRSGASGRAG
ncbi:hypothetical protein [Micromonospora sp. WMMD1274]|uniref:hypothetical protein n=1 Tax=Micromonospora sp. WMMD1274 TaxID=3404116 RepID=UPI003B95B058